MLEYNLMQHCTICVEWSTVDCASVITRLTDRRTRLVTTARWEGVENTVSTRYIFTVRRSALHGLCDSNSVRPSVRLSVRLSVCLSVTLVDCVHTV